MIAPVLYGASSGSDRWSSSHRADGRLEILRPRWIYPPGTGLFTAVFLFLQLIPLVRRLKKKFPFQVIDSHFGFPEGIAAALLSVLFRVPFTVTMRGSEVIHSRFLFRRYGISWALRRATLVIAVSAPLRKLALDLGVDPERIAIIPNGVDARVFLPRPRAQCRTELGLPLNRPLILSAGHLIELKGHHLVIEAVQRLNENGVPVLLLIAGGPPGRGLATFEPYLRRMVADARLHDCVQFLGPVSQGRLADLMSAADVFCLASSREGWPNVVHEALACGTPAVATNVGAVPEIISSSQMGLVVPPGDAAALTAALKLALDTHWDRDVISTRAHSRSWEQAARETLEHLSSRVPEDPGRMFRGPGAATERAGEGHSNLS